MSLNLGRLQLANWWAGIWSHQFRRTTLVAATGLAITLGVVLARWWAINWTWLAAIILFWPILRQRRAAAVIWIVAVGVFFGLWRGQQMRHDERQLTQFYGQKITVIARVNDEAAYDQRGRTVFSATAIKLMPDRANIAGSLLQIGTFDSAGVLRGDIIQITGKLMPMRGLALGSIGYGTVSIIGRDNSWYYRLRNKFVAGLYNALPEPAASFAAGLLLGQKTGLSDSWNTIIRGAGLMHVIAVSGYNLTILVRFVRRLLAKRSRYQVLMLSLLLVLGFVMLTGQSPSIMRATIVVVLSMVAWYFGRHWKPLPLIMVSAAISALIDPSQLWRSVGWYLSFMAFYGVLVLAPAMMRLLRWDQKHHLLLAILAESLAAQLMTWPISATVFGQISLVGLLANMIVAGFLPLAMLLSLIAGLGGWLIPAWAGWLAWPARYVLTFILDIANLVARLPGANVQIQPPIGLTIGLLAVLCLASLVLWRIVAMIRRSSDDFLNSTDEQLVKMS